VSIGFDWGLGFFGFGRLRRTSTRVRKFAMGLIRKKPPMLPKTLVRARPPDPSRLVAAWLSGSPFQPP